MLKGSTNYNLSTDVFSYAVMMSEVISGEAPYEYKNFTRFNFEHPTFVIQGGVKIIIFMNVLHNYCLFVT